MSSIKLAPNASGTGALTIAAPNTNTDRTLTLPDSSGTIATAESTLSQFNASGSAPVYAARAWVNFNGTGTVAIRASGNVSSITDNGVGDYTVNLTTQMPDANYSAAMSVQRTGSDTNIYPSLFFGASPSQTASTVRLQVRTGSSYALEDPVVANVAIFR